MDIQLEKYKLMEWLVSLKDEAIITKLNAIKTNISNSNEWAEDISNTEKALIKAGLKDIENQNTSSHKDVMKEINDAYGI